MSKAVVEEILLEAVSLATKMFGYDYTHEDVFRIYDLLRQEKTEEMLRKISEEYHAKRRG